MGKKMIIGQKFGRWSILEKAGKDKWGKDLWKCRCGCGAIKVVDGTSLRIGKTKSCGCLKRELTSKRNIIDLVGKRFGRLVVLEETGKNKRRDVLWRCQCDCGTIKIVNGASLRKGHTKSCGCLQRERACEKRKLNLKGKRFGRLIVLEETGKDKWRNVLWGCQCDCGAIKVVCGVNLRWGNSKSCGCLQKEIASELRKNETGKDNLNYNPNLTDEDRQDRRLIPGYNDWHKAVLKRDSYICQCCRKCGGRLNAHHLESYINNPELRIILGNGITLCEECHNDFHHQYGKGNNTRKQFEKFLCTQRN